MNLQWRRSRSEETTQAPGNQNNSFIELRGPSTTAGTFPPFTSAQHQASVQGRLTVTHLPRQPTLASPASSSARGELPPRPQAPGACGRLPGAQPHPARRHRNARPCPSPPDGGSLLRPSSKPSFSWPLLQSPLLRIGGQSCRPPAHSRSPRPRGHHGQQHRWFSIKSCSRPPTGPG